MRTAARPASPRFALLGALLALVVTAVGLTAAVPAPPRRPSTVVGVASRPLPGRGRQRPDRRTGVNIYDCNGQANQAWTLTSAGELRVYDDTDVPGRGRPGHHRARPRCRSTPAPAAPTRSWRINTDGTIVGVQSGLCLDVTGAGTANSTTVGLWTCNGQAQPAVDDVLGSADTSRRPSPGNPRVSNLTCNSVTFAWNASTDNVGVAFYDVYHDGQLMTSVSGTTLSDQPDRGGRGDLGPVRQRPRRRRQRVPGEHAPCRSPRRHCQADTQAPTAPQRAHRHRVRHHRHAALDRVDRQRRGPRATTSTAAASKVGTVTGTAPPARTTFTDSGLAASTALPRTTWSPGTRRTTPRRAAAPRPSPPARRCAQPGVRGHPGRHRHRHPVGPGDPARRHGPLQPPRRARHHPAQPGHRRQDHLGTVPNVQSTDGEGGLLGLAISASFASDHWLYIMHTSPTRQPDRADQARERRASTPPASRSSSAGILRNKYHDGGRLRFGPDGKLYASTGDAQNGDNAQNLSSLNGKVLRLNPDGTVPSDNPFGNYVWSYGHRNPQGLAFDSQGRLWEQEFGNSVMDETNLITKGGNYGWPACEGTSGTCGTAGFIAPKRTYPTAEGSCSGIAIVRDALYVACERGTRMYRAVISGSSLTNVQTYFSRHLRSAADGRAGARRRAVADHHQHR